MWKPDTEGKAYARKVQLLFCNIKNKKNLKKILMLYKKHIKSKKKFSSSCFLFWISVVNQYLMVLHDRAKHFFR